MLDDDPVNRKIKIAAFNLRTGALKGERTYGWTDNAVTDGIYHGGGSYGSAFLNGNDLYIHQGQRLALYDFNNYVPGAEPVKKWAQERYDQRPRWAWCIRTGSISPITTAMA